MSAAPASAREVLGLGGKREVSAAPVGVADVLSVGELRPGPVPVLRPVPAAIGTGEWPAYRLVAPPAEGMFPPERLRRLGRGQAMALAAVKLAVDGCAPPAEKGPSVAVSLGTGWAEKGDEIAFLENLIKHGEKGARPALFVNSVHNALASQVALAFGFEGENHTFTHDELSLESALWAGIQALRQERVARAVVCGVDALVEFPEIRGHLLGHYHQDPAPLAPLSGPGRPRGSLPGEGAAAFVLGPPGSAAPLARVLGVKARGPKRRGALDEAHQLDFVEGALAEMGLSPARVSFVLLGANADPELDAIHARVADGLTGQIAPRAGVGVYRHLTGDFATASALGLAAAVRMVAGRSLVPEVRVVGAPPSAAPECVLLFHLAASGNHSVMVVSA